jgi:hypothetical protein
VELAVFTVLNSNTMGEENNRIGMQDAMSLWGCKQIQASDRLMILILPSLRNWSNYKKKPTSFRFCNYLPTSAVPTYSIFSPDAKDKLCSYRSFISPQSLGQYLWDIVQKHYLDAC